jgi:hypothetical protein
MPGTHGFALALPAFRSPFGAGQSLLRRRQRVRSSTAPARIIDVCPVARGGETGSGLVGTSSHESTSSQCRP